MINADEIMVAHSMLRLVTSPATADFEPFQRFMCYWMAFNNIYTTLSDKIGKKRSIRFLPDGNIKTQIVHGIRMSAVRSPTEKDQLDLALKNFSVELKHRLILHKSTKFFVYRTPKWGYRRIKKDANGQYLNGVLNLTHTLDAKYPVWAPLDNALYEKYLAGTQDKRTRNILANQILLLLYTVRNNTFHGGKRADDSNDKRVLSHATLLLKIIVEELIQ